jgi:hypothetical protein
MPQAMLIISALPEENEYLILISKEIFRGILIFV